jgi:hypothetical protein
MKRYPAQPPIPRFGLAGAPLALALLVGGCATTEVAVAPEPAAAAAEAEVSAIAGAARTYPRFSDIPTLPEDTRPLAVWGQAAGEVLGSGSDLVRDTGDETWTLRGTEAFASGARQDSGPAAPLVSATAAAESFAREVRKRATPPPPPVR